MLGLDSAHRVWLYAGWFWGPDFRSPALTAGALPMELVLLFRFSAFLPVTSLGFFWL